MEMRLCIGSGLTVKEILAGWNEAKLASTVAAKVNGVPVDLGHSPDR